MQNDNPYAPPTSEVDDPQVASMLVNPAADQPLVYAGFWRRFGAYWIDVVAMLPLSVMAYFLSDKVRLFYLYWLIPSLLIGLWFHVYLVVRYGGTPGKILLKTRIAMTDGAAITQRAAIIRYAVLFILSATTSVAYTIAVLHMTDATYFSLGFIARSQQLVALTPSWNKPVSILLQIWIWGEFVTMLFNKKRRAVHDFLAGTIVVRRNATA